MSVLLLSGGLDSAVILAREVDRRQHTLCLAVSYGQRHAARELWASHTIAHYYGCKHFVVNLPPVVLAGSALTGKGPVPHAHHADPAQAATVVPNRNMVLIAIAASFAAREGMPTVLFAAHAGDAAIYPDCRPVFVEAIDRVTQFACGVAVEAPFLAMTKRDIVALGRSLSVPFDMTWTCYEGGDEPCQKCGACVERNEAMA